MKKITNLKLVLQKETVRPLDQRQLEAAAGGRAYNTNLTYRSPCTYTPTQTCW